MSVLVPIVINISSMVFRESIIGMVELLNTRYFPFSGKQVKNKYYLIWLKKLEIPNAKRKNNHSEEEKNTLKKDNYANQREKEYHSI